jgi:hypothetical protein
LVDATLLKGNSNWLGELLAVVVDAPEHGRRVE